MLDSGDASNKAQIGCLPSRNSQCSEEDESGARI